MSLSMQTFIFAQDVSPSPSSEPTDQTTKITEETVENIARQITVKIISNNNGLGSGIIIKQQKTNNKQLDEYVYLVLTNNHVIENIKNKVTVETPDGRLHDSTIYSAVNNKFNKLDLALLWFISSQLYNQAKLGDSSKIREQDTIYVAGFPCQDGTCEKADYKITKGEGFLWDKVLSNGYQVAYNNTVENGSSGGPVLNEKGEVIAVNGRQKTYTLSSKFKEDQNGNPLIKEDIKFIKYFAWGIPINQYIKIFSNPPVENIIKDYNQTQPTTTNPNKDLTITQSLNNFVSNNIGIFLLLICVIILVFIILLIILIFSISHNSRKLSQLLSQVKPPNPGKQQNN